MYRSSDKEKFKWLLRSIALDSSTNLGFFNKISGHQRWESFLYRWEETPLSLYFPLSLPLLEDSLISIPCSPPSFDWRQREKASIVVLLVREEFWLWVGLSEFPGKHSETELCLGRPADVRRCRNTCKGWRKQIWQRNKTQLRTPCILANTMKSSEARMELHKCPKVQPLPPY